MTLQKVCDIDEMTDKIKEALFHINETSQENNEILEELQKDIIENGVKLDCLKDRPADPPGDINVTVNCNPDGTAPGEPPVCPDCPPGGGVDPTDLCLSTTNQLLDGDMVSFK